VNVSIIEWERRGSTVDTDANEEQEARKPRQMGSVSTARLSHACSGEGSDDAHFALCGMHCPLPTATGRGGGLVAHLVPVRRLGAVLLHVVNLAAQKATCRTGIDPVSLPEHARHNA
jgi:hypothetical protein